MTFARLILTDQGDGTLVPPSYQLHLQLLQLISMGLDLLDCILDRPIRLVAADAGFFPPGPLTLFADIVTAISSRK